MTIKNLRRLSTASLLVVIHFLTSKINIFTCKQKYNLVRSLTVLSKHERDSHWGEHEQENSQDKRGKIALENIVSDCFVLPHSGNFINFLQDRDFFDRTR
jgi:hypothetical protein